MIFIREDSFIDGRVDGASGCEEICCSLYLLAPQLRLAGVELGSRVLHVGLNPNCDRVRPAKNAPRDRCRLLEHRHGLAEIVERCGGQRGACSVTRTRTLWRLKNPCEMREPSSAPARRRRRGASKVLRVTQI